ncbi:MAG TPA: excinuclease ABC subunit UvrC [Sulfurivirga caldicuralii]|nr:excinuclease ABC subunit UvrC [Sulfurivirga caldicuralii]
MSDFDIKAFLQQLPERPGVYQMFNARGQVIYVGKAKNLKRRVSAYFHKQHDSIKTQKLVEQVARIEVTLTETEAEAFLLESTLIKRLNPRYNVLFRDDKSYPYIYVSTQDRFPGLYFHRGAKKRAGEYFGPFPNAAAVYETLHTLQKIFPVRQCADSVFNNRSRPCLQHQIGRCSAPCVGLISEQAYAQDVQHTLLFLQGKRHEVIEQLGQKMLAASERLEFEKAAQLRDRIAALRSIQQQHLIHQGKGALDVVAVAQRQGVFAITLMRYQGGTLWGTEHFFPKGDLLVSSEVVSQFLVQYYRGKSMPDRVLVAVDLGAEAAWFKALDIPVAQARSRTERELVALAETNARTALRQHLSQKSTQQQKLLALQDVLGLQKLPRVMECFDVSHTQGGETVASCVCFIDGVPEKQRYRRYNIRQAAAGDDYAAIYEVVARHYRRLQQQPDQLPDLVVIDGGRGQLHKALEALVTLGLEDLPVVSVAKGEGRKPGLECLYTPYCNTGIDLPADEPALHLINFLRDEAHRFAISGHRARRQKRQLRSTLEEIAGVGPKTRKRLLTHFGGLKGIQDASVSELVKVPGVSKKLAQRIYDHFHGEIE